LKLWDQQLLHRGPLEWHYLPTNFHENAPIRSKVDRGDRQDGNLIVSFRLLESRIKNGSNNNNYGNNINMSKNRIVALGALVVACGNINTLCYDGLWFGTVVYCPPVVRKILWSGSDLDAGWYARPALSSDLCQKNKISRQQPTRGPIRVP
jgi:hypothetical protein